MAKVWLTYAWKDNEDQDADHVISELQKVGLEVGFDRAHIIPGQRLWPQIDSGISDPKTDGWAILVTENSLNSEPCLEELAYALDRTLRTRGTDFPLIGIFPRPMDRAIIPSAIATRLYVNLQQSNWALLVADGIEKRRPSAGARVSPFVARVHSLEGKEVLEVRPRSGRWYPGVVGCKASSGLKVTRLMPGPSGHPTIDGMVKSGEGKSADGLWEYKAAFHSIDPLNSLYAMFSGPLRGEISFGGTQEGEVYFIDAALIPRA